MRSRWVYALLLVVLAMGTHFLHRQAVVGVAERETAGPLPNARVLRFLTSSHHTSAADLYWLKLVQYVGTEAALRAGWPDLEALADLVVTLDPKYGYAYQASGILLSTAGRIDASNEILERGMANVPGRWQLPFYAGFNRWYHQRQFREAGELLLRASRLPGRPDWLAALASRLFASSGSIDDGIALLDLMIANTEAPLLRRFQPLVPPAPVPRGRRARPSRLAPAGPARLARRTRQPSFREQRLDRRRNRPAGPDDRQHGGSPAPRRLHPATRGPGAREDAAANRGSRCGISGGARPLATEARGAGGSRDPRLPPHPARPDPALESRDGGGALALPTGSVGAVRAERGAGDPRGATDRVDRGIAMNTTSALFALGRVALVEALRERILYGL